MDILFQVNTGKKTMDLIGSADDDDENGSLNVSEVGEDTCQLNSLIFLERFQPTHPDAQSDDVDN